MEDPLFHLTPQVCLGALKQPEHEAWNGYVLYGSVKNFSIRGAYINGRDLVLTAHCMHAGQ